MANSTNGDLTDSKEADWISLMDYATRYGVSLSTLRRHIKADKVQYKVEHGRYLLRSPYAAGTAVPRSAVAQVSSQLSQAGQHALQHATSAPIFNSPTLPASSNSAETYELNLKLQLAQEEIAELKMLIALYEEQLQPERPGQLRMNGH